MVVAILMVVAVLGAVVAVILIVTSLRPDQFRVERSITIGAAPEDIFPLIDTLQSWTGWSPWENRDPNLRRTYAGPASGVGASYAWAGDRRVGEGRMEIIKSLPPSRLSIRLEFLKPFAATNTAEFVLVPAGSGTTVTWAMFGRPAFMMKLMGLFLDMDKMVGKDFDAGLRGLKAQAESRRLS